MFARCRHLRAWLLRDSSSCNKVLGRCIEAKKRLITFTDDATPYTANSDVSSFAGVTVNITAAYIVPAAVTAAVVAATAAVVVAAVATIAIIVVALAATSAVAAAVATATAVVIAVVAMWHRHDRSVAASAEFGTDVDSTIVVQAGIWRVVPVM